MIDRNLKKTIVGLCSGLLCLSASSVQAYDACYNSCYDPCDQCDQFWFDAEYLYWGMKNSPQSTVLVEEGASLDTLTPVIGGNHIDNNWRSGGRFGLGYWFDETRLYGVEGLYFFIPTGSNTKSVSSTGLEGSNYLVAPFYNVVTGSEVLDNYIAEPLVYSGVATRKVSNWMQGAELNGLAVFPCGCDFNVSALIGFRYWNFDEDLTFNVSSPSVDEADDVWLTSDKFNVQNNFYGGQVGIGVDYMCDCFSVNVKAKVALGAMCEQLKIHGSLLTNEFDLDDQVVQYVGGIYALPTNIGSHSKTNFSVIPEVQVNLGYQVTDCFRLKLGYTFFYVSNMVWAGDQIDANINPSQSISYNSDPNAVLDGVASPTAFLKTSSFWAQGVNAGFEFQF